MEDDRYCDRLVLAMKRAGIDVRQLAAHLGMTYQGAKKATDGGPTGRSEMMASNHMKAAQLLRVDPDWLASGAGTMHEKVWPFERVSRDLVHTLSATDIAAVEGAMLAALSSVKASMPSNVTPKPESRQTPGKEQKGGLKSLTGRADHGRQSDKKKAR